MCLGDVALAAVACPVMHGLPCDARPTFTFPYLSLPAEGEFQRKVAFVATKWDLTGLDS